MKATALLQQKLDFFTRKNLSKKPRTFYKLKMCDKVLYNIYLQIKTKMIFTASLYEKYCAS